MRRTGVLGLGCAGVVVGVLAEHQAYAWRDLGNWLPDLLAGWTLIAAGVALLALRRRESAPALMLVAGFTWFAFNFRDVAPASGQWLAVHAAYVHRAPLLELALAPPHGRPRDRTTTAGVALVWIAAVVWPLWDRDATALLVAALVVALAAVARARARGARRRAITGRALAAAGVLSAAIAADALRSIAGASPGVGSVTVAAYAIAVAVAGVLLFSAALLDAPAALAERTVALERGGKKLRDALREVLGDPDVDIGFADGRGRFADEDGHALEPPADGRAETRVAIGGADLGIVLHHPATLADADTRKAVVAAVGLAAERARLRTEVVHQAATVEASRQRLLLAEEAERARLAERVRQGPGRQLEAVERVVADLLERGPVDDGLTAALERAAEQLALARPELDALARGLGHPGDGGLIAALETLRAGMPIAIDLDVAGAGLEMRPDVASVIWFACSEALVNVVKHAEVEEARVALDARSGVVTLTVEDDGVGGADPAGSGLAGLADRVAAYGGRLVVDSPAGRGTRIRVELPSSTRGVVRVTPGEDRSTTTGSLPAADATTT